MDDDELAAFMPDSWPPLAPVFVSRPGLPLSRPDERLPLLELPERPEPPELPELPELAERPELPELPELPDALIPLPLRLLSLRLLSLRLFSLRLLSLLEWLLWLPLLCLLAIRTPPDLELELDRVRGPSRVATDMPQAGAAREPYIAIDS